MFVLELNVVLFDCSYPQASALVISTALASTTYLQELDTCVSDVAHPDIAKAMSQTKAVNLVNFIFPSLLSIS